MHKTFLASFAFSAMFLSEGLVAQSGQGSDTLIRGVNYVGVSVSDIDSAAAFYGNSANLQTVRSSVIEGNHALDEVAGRENVRAKTRLLKSSNAQLRFMEFANPSVKAKSSAQVDVHGPGIAHICFQVAETTQTYQRFLEAGATAIGDPEMVQLNPRNPVVYAYARDADGAIIEIEHIDFDKVSTPRNKDYRIRHISLASPNVERMVGFYSILMQQPEPRRVGQGGTLAGENFDKVSGLAGTKMEMAWFQARNLELEIVQYHSHPSELLSEPRPLEALGYNMIVFDVMSLDQARERLLEAGGRVVSEITATDDGVMFFARDPDDNLLGFQVSEDDAAVSSQNFENNGV